MKRKISIQWSRQARLQLFNIADLIRKDKQSAALAWVQKVEKKVLRLQKFPLSGRVVSELKRLDIRELIEGSYRVIHKYKVNEEIAVLSVFHGAKKLNLKNH